MCNFGNDYIRCKMVTVGRLMFDRQLTDAGGGNISTKHNGLIYVTPMMSGERLRWQLQPDDLIAIDAQTMDVVENDPTMLTRESMMHLGIYQAIPEVGAVLHAHPRYCMVYAAANKKMPANNENFEYFAGEAMDCLKEVPGTSTELAKEAISYFYNRRHLISERAVGALIPRHGIVIAAKNLDEAFCLLDNAEVNAMVGFQAALAMARQIKALALDFGSSSARGIVGAFDGKGIAFSEITRCGNQAVEIRGNLYWDIVGMYRFARDTISRTPGLSCMGIDTWGVDFGLLDRGGRLIGLPYSYRDPEVGRVAEEVFGRISEYELFQSSGVMIEPIAPLVQLCYWKKYMPEMLEAANSLQLMANLVAYLLTGEMSFDNSMASASGFYNIANDTWDKGMLTRLGLPDILTPTFPRPDVIGETAALDGAGKNIPVMRVCGHDTSSALMAVPARNRETALYVSCGSWVMAGCYLKQPMVTLDAYEAKLSNENGFDGEINLLRYINGLYILQECVKEWRLCCDYDIDYPEMESAAECLGFESAIDPDHSDFLTPGNMCGKIGRYLVDTGQRQADSRVKIYAAIMNGIAKSVAQTFTDIRRLVPRAYERIYIIGGGARSGYLCRRISALTELPLTAGPIEATAVGNICAQLIRKGEMADLNEAMEILEISKNAQNF